MADGNLIACVLLPPAWSMLVAYTVRPAMSTILILYLPLACVVNSIFIVVPSTGLGDTLIDGLPFTATAAGRNTTLNLLAADDFASAVTAKFTLVTVLKLIAVLVPR